MHEKIPLIDVVDFDPHNHPEVLVTHTNRDFCMGVILFSLKGTTLVLVVSFTDPTNGVGANLDIEVIFPRREFEPYINKIFLDWYTKNAKFTKEDALNENAQIQAHEDIHKKLKAQANAKRSGTLLDVNTIVSYFFTLVQIGYEPKVTIQ